jgi:glycosyltransferase
MTSIGPTISIITVVYNNVGQILTCLGSVGLQKYERTEHVIIDGASSDGTTQSIAKFTKKSNTVFVSEPDNGIYDAINKGIKMASGDVIGLLHSDDVFDNDRVLVEVAESFADESVIAVYGDLKFVNTTGNGKVLRYWRSRPFSKWLLAFGWMPPHPTFFVRKRVFETVGYYCNTYSIAGDYDFLLRFFRAGLKSKYIPITLTLQASGGVSNSSFKNLLIKSKEDYKILRKYFSIPIIPLVFKNMKIIWQVFKR